jgi:glycosyltransferase involved in cell wall biosynthesis
MKHPSVLFFIPTLEAGGAERACITYMRNLKGLCSALAVQLQQGPLLEELPLHLPIFETATGSELFERTLWSQPFFLLSQAHRLKKLAAQNGCKALISFITMPNIIALLAKFFFDRRLKVIINVHDVTSRILEHSKLKPYERFLLRRLIRFFYPRADVIVAVAQGIKRDLIESFGVPLQKIVVIYNPIDVHGICGRAAEPVTHPWFADRSEPLLIAVGRLVKLKGFDLLIRSVAQLSVPAKLAIIGDGEERAALESLVRELGLTDRVVLLGFQENPWRYMARADLFVLSSLTEGMPNVIGEAMALGLPVVATDCSPGVREYLDDGRAGLLVPPGDPRALAQGIEQLLSDEPLRRELARRGRERIVQFDLSATVRAYESLLEHLL